MALNFAVKTDSKNLKSINSYEFNYSFREIFYVYGIITRGTFNTYSDPTLEQQTVASSLQRKTREETYWSASTLRARWPRLSLLAKWKTPKEKHQFYPHPAFI